jgi:hypothetical protein
MAHEGMLRRGGDGSSSGTGDDGRQNKNAESEFHTWLPLTENSEEIN